MDLPQHQSLSYLVIGQCRRVAPITVFIPHPHPIPHPIPHRRTLRTPPPVVRRRKANTKRSGRRDDDPGSQCDVTAARQPTRGNPSADGSRKANIYIGGVNGSNTASDIRAHLAKHRVTVALGDIRELANHGHWKPFRVTIPAGLVERVTSAGRRIWPSGVRCRPFKHRPRGGNPTALREKATRRPLKATPTHQVSSFWNQIKNRRQKQIINSSLDAHQLAEYYRGTMGSDNTPLTPCQCQITNVLRDTFHDWVGSPQHTVFTDRQIDRAICALRKNVSAGIDGISAEYFIYGNSEILRSHLLAIYNSMFNRTTVPSVLVTGIIIPILKKSTLDPNIVNNFRPITLGSTHGKLIEFLILPADMAHPNQFGFRKGRGTAMACNCLNDLSLYCKSKGSLLYICSLDAEKCFDTIWHDGLFYKLLDVLPRSYWLFL